MDISSLFLISCFFVKHVLADWEIPKWFGRWMSAGKREPLPYCLKPLLLHCLFHAFLTGLFVSEWLFFNSRVTADEYLIISLQVAVYGPLFAAIDGLSHLVIDFTKTRLEMLVPFWGRKRSLAFLGLTIVDQICHFSVYAIVVYVLLYKV
jgi:hypothetical protein